MPVTIQLTGLKYKNSQGQFQSADCLKGEDADISIIAPDYSELTFPVNAGKLCTRDLKLYIAKQGIPTSENWTESHWDERTIEEELAAKYTKPAGGIPASDLADGVIPDIIDDEAGAGDTDVTFSADKLTSEFDALSNALNQSTSATNSDIGKAHSPKTVDENGHVTEWQYVEVGGGNVSILIAASNSSADDKGKADYICEGSNDQITINNVLESLSKGEVCLLAGDYYISGEINPVSNVDIKGLGNPVLHLTNRVVTTLAQAVSVNDETIYLTDPSDFVVGQKIGIKYGSTSGSIDYEVGHIKTIDYETGAVTMYARTSNMYSADDVKTIVGKVNHSADAGSYVLTDPSVIMGWNVDNVTVSGLIIDGNSSNLGDYISDTDFGSNLIEWKGGSNVRILKNKLINCYKHSVLFVYGTTNSFVCENVINSALTHGIDFYTNVENNLMFGNVLTEANIQTHGGRKTIISNNRLKNCQLANSGGQYNLVIGNKIDNSDRINGRCMSVSGSGAKWNNIIGNIFIGAAQGIQLDNSGNFKVSGNKFVSNRSEAIHLYAAKDCSVDGNDIYLSNANATGAAIKIENASTKNIIIGNTIHGTSNKTSHGVNETGNSADYNIIVNNVIFDATTGVEKVGTNSVAQNNIVV